MRKHFSDIPRPNADTDTEPDADAHPDADADANANAHTDPHTDADTHALSWADECHDYGEPEPGDADKPGGGRLRLEHAQSVGLGADP